MKILYLLDKFPRISETFILNEIIALKQTGHTVIIAANEPCKGRFHEGIRKYNLLDDTIYPSEKPNFSGYENGTQKALDFLPKLFKDFIRRPFRTIETAYKAWEMSSDIWIFLDSYLLARQIKDSNIDIVHAPYAYLRHLEMAALLSDLFCVPFTYTFRSEDLYVEGRGEKKMRLVKRPSKTITISDYNRSNCMKKYGIRNAAIIHDSIDVYKFQPSEVKKSRKIICICRFIECKGVEYLIEACRILNGRGEDFTCALIGGGPLKDRYERLIRDYGLQEIITIKGFLTQEEVKKELDDSMIFVLPCVVLENGEKDILPNVLKEAMAMEIPVVTSDICGIEELVRHNENGLLVPSRDSAAVADAIEKLLKSGELRERLGKKGRETIEKDFNAVEESKKLEKIFREVMVSSQQY